MIAKHQNIIYQSRMLGPTFVGMQTEFFMWYAKADIKYLTTSLQKANTSHLLIIGRRAERHLD